MPEQIRNADWNDWTVNGVTGKKHIETYDSPLQYTKTILSGGICAMYVAIRAWVLSEDSSTVEIGTAGTYKAIASGTPTATKAIIMGSWTYPDTAMVPTDAIKVNVYCRLVDSSFTEADLAYTLVTEQLGAQSLDSNSLWLITWIQVTAPNYSHLFYFGWYEEFGEYWSNFYLASWLWTPYVPPVTVTHRGDGLVWTIS